MARNVVNFRIPLAALVAFVPVSTSGRAVFDDTASVTYRDGAAVHGSRNRRAEIANEAGGPRGGLTIEFLFNPLVAAYCFYCFWVWWVVAAAAVACGQILPNPIYCSKVWVSAFIWGKNMIIFFPLGPPYESYDKSCKCPKNATYGWRVMQG